MALRIGCRTPEDTATGGWPAHAPAAKTPVTGRPAEVTTFVLASTAIPPMVDVRPTASGMAYNGAFRRTGSPDRGAAKPGPAGPQSPISVIDRARFAWSSPVRAARASTEGAATISAPVSKRLGSGGTI